MRTRLSILCGAVLLFVVLHSTPAQAAVRLGLGADYWMDRGGAFELTLAVDTPLAKRVTVGGRFGAMIATSPNLVGVPLDLQLRANIGSAYVEGLVGPWILFGGDPIRAHAAFGFGLRGRSVSLGLEVGWLDPSAIVGLRLSIPM